MSITWSAARIMSSSCSTTITLLPNVAQVLQRGDQAVVVALVQADAGLVQHIHHARQARADLEARRMRCASPPESVRRCGPGSGSSGPRRSKLQARGDLAHHLVGNLGLWRR